MIILIGGSPYTGRTLLAQKLLEKYKISYLSTYYLKMALIRSGNTDFTEKDDDKQAEYIWNIIKEIIKINIENNQKIIIQGSYIPFNWKDDFDEEYLKEMQYVCLIMTEKYINTHYPDKNTKRDLIGNPIIGNIISKEKLIKENKYNYEMCKKYNYKYILIDDKYEVDLEL